MSQLVQQWVKALLDHSFGTHTIDCFASCNNLNVQAPPPPPDTTSALNQMQNGFNVFLDLGTFSTTWKQLDPPSIPTGGQALRHLKICQAQGTIILPKQELAPWWPFAASLPPSCDCLSLQVGQASGVLCFPLDSRYSVMDPPRGTILALHFQ